MARITQADLDSLRMPPDALGNPGLQDIEALKAAAWGTDYDVDARRRAIEEARNRITAALVAQQVPVQLAQQIADQQITQTSGGGDTSQGQSSQTSSGATSFGEPGNTGPGGNTGQGFSGWGGSVAPGSDFMTGAPPGPSMFGSGRTSSLADPFGEGDMVTANAAMMSGSGLPDPNPDPGYSNVAPYGREGDDTSAQSQAAQGRDAAAMAAAAQGRGPVDAFGSMDRSQTAPGWGRGPADPDAVAAVAQAAPTAPTTFADPIAPTTVADPDALAEGMGGKGDKGYVSGTYAPNFDRAFSEADKASPTYGGAILSNTTAIPGVPGIPSVTPDVPVAPTQTATPTTTPTTTPVAAPVSFGRNAPTGVPGEADPGGGAVAGPGGFGGFSESTPGGYAGGPGMTTGFGAGYSGSSDFGNTQGAQGFTTGSPGFSSGQAQGFTTGAFTAGFQAGFDTAAAAFGGGGADPGGGAGTGADTGAGGGSSSSGGDTAGGSPGGVG